MSSVITSLASYHLDSSLSFSHFSSPFPSPPTSLFDFLKKSPDSIHFSLFSCHCVCVCACAKLLQSCLTIRDPMDCSMPGSSVHSFSRQVYWSGLSCPPPGALPDPGIEPASLSSPALAAYCWHLLASPPSFIFQIQIIMTFHSLLPSLLHPNLPLVC